MRRKSERILMVEDRVRLATLRRAVLADHGYDVTCVMDSKEACQLLLRKHYDLVLADYSKLPKGSDLEIVAVAKKKNLPVILSSGWSHRMSQEELARSNVDFVIPKPCSTDYLLSIIRNALKKS